MQTTIIGTDVYLEVDLAVPGFDNKKWMHLDGTKLKLLSSLGIGDPSDPTNLAAFDDQSRLTSLTVKVPPLSADRPASTTTVTLSDFGAPVTIAAPAKAQTQEAPANLYAALGG